MSTPNWQSSELDHEFHVYMVDPLNHDAILGELEVYADSGSVTWSEEDETGIGLTASVEVPDWTKWIEGSWLRIVHRIPSCNYTRILGTFIVWDDGASGGLDTYSGSPELDGVFRGIEEDLMPNILVVGEGASMKQAVARLLGATPVPYRFSGNFKDYRFTEPHVWDAGESRLDVLRELCNLAGNTIYPGNTGYILITPKITASNAFPTFTIDCDAENSIVYEGTLHPETEARQMPGRAIALWNGREEEGAASLSGYADVSARHFASPQKRGFVVAEVHEIDDFPFPRTQAHLQTLARRFLREDSETSQAWSMETVWLPLEAGNVVSFRPPGLRFRTCKVTTVTANLSNWTTTLTLKEV